MALLALEAAHEHDSEPVLVPVAPQVTYVEIRWWARWLVIFTASDLADAMAVDLAIGERGIKALLWHGLVADTGESIDGPWGAERVVEYQDPRLLPGPREHPVLTPPERLVGYTEVLSPRGITIRLIDNTDRRKQMQVAGTGNKMRMRLRDERYRRLKDAKRERAERDRLRRLAAAQAGGTRSKKQRFAHTAKKRPDKGHGA